MESKEMKIEHLTLNRRELKFERQQLVDEGRDTGPVEKEFERLLALDDRELENKQEEVGALLDKTIQLPLKDDYPYYEPSDLEGIREARPQALPAIDFTFNEQHLRDRVYGAWLGRIAGCLLGKPVEGWDSRRMWGYLKDLGRYPLAEYFSSDVPRHIAEKYRIHERTGFIDQVKHMIWDDDINYTVAGMLILKSCGMDFTPGDVSLFWLENIPILSTWTAERTSYRNFLNGIAPPESAEHRNVYREWIGAQIRADAYGYLALGAPELAAEYAWRDASVSHVKNGIYGSMWVAAMLASAPFLSTAREVVISGLAQIPARCRLTGHIHKVIGWYDEGLSYEKVIARIHASWDEHFGHHWCHTISNAQLVALGLLWGEGDFEKSICRAVQGCFDTDCNGATVGSVVGMMKGAQELPEKWIAPLDNKLETTLAGYQLVEIDELAEECFELYLSLERDKPAG